MTNSLLTVAVSTPSMALRYAAAFFLVIVGIGLIYALIRLGGTLGSAEKLLTDVDTEIVPLLKQATETLDGVNTELDKVDVVMSSVVDVTEKVDQTTRVVESAITVPAKKAAAFGAGVSQAVSSFFNRGSDAGEPVADDDGPSSGASWSPPAGYAPAAAAPSPAADEPAAPSQATAPPAAVTTPDAGLPPDAGSATDASRRNAGRPSVRRTGRGERRVKLWGTLVFGAALAGGERRLLRARAQPGHRAELCRSPAAASLRSAAGVRRGPPPGTARHRRRAAGRAHARAPGRQRPCGRGAARRRSRRLKRGPLWQTRSVLK